MTFPTGHNTTAQRFRRLIANGFRDRSGNVIMIFGLSSFVIMGFVGAAIDFSRVDMARRHLQDAADAAVLRTMPMTTASDAARELAADRTFAENLKSPDIFDIHGDLIKEVSGNSVSQTYKVNAMVTSYFGAFFGKKDYPVTVVSQARSQNDIYEIAFVLDTTLSMAEASKMPNLKSSVNSALNSLLDSSGENRSHSRVAIVPFNTQVRLADDTRLPMVSSGLLQGSGDGCIGDRSQPYDVSAEMARAGTSTVYRQGWCGGNSGLKTISGLSENLGEARKAVNALTPAGMTNITIGVQWGMEVLSPNAPFNEAVDFSDTTVRKVMIVVTDGKNTRNSWSFSESEINKRTALACQAAKAKGITVFTVKVIEGDSNMLRKCASSPENFYDLTSAAQLNGAMSGIFKAIYQTRLTM